MEETTARSRKATRQVSISTTLTQLTALALATLIEIIRNLTLDGEETKRYREFDDETGLPTHDWKGDPLTHVEDLKAKKQFKEQQKTFEEREWKGESWDETQLGVFFLKKRNVLLELRSNVRKWDLERRKREEREEKNLKPETATEGAIILKNAFDKAKKYDSDRRNKADSRKTMLAMLAAENKLDELLVNLDNKMKEKKEELDEEEAIEKKDTTNTGEIINSTNKENVTISPNEENVSTSTNLLKKYGKIDPTIPSKPFNPHSTTWLKHTSLKYEVLRKRRDKSHLIVDGNREKGEGMRRTEKMKGVKSKLKTRWTVPPPLI